MKKLHWNQETLEYFSGLYEINGFAHIAIRALEFVKANCTIEDGETESDLFNDLITQIEQQIFK